MLFWRARWVGDKPEKLFELTNGLFRSMMSTAAWECMKQGPRYKLFWDSVGWLSPPASPWEQLSEAPVREGYVVRITDAPDNGVFAGMDGGGSTCLVGENMRERTFL